MAQQTPALTQEQKEIAAQDRIRSFLTDLYGEEEMLIVRNTTNGVVSIGFGELGDKGGKAIDRSKLPIVLTDEFPRDTWIKAADFRRAVAKGWLIPVSKSEYDGELQKHRDHVAALTRLAAKDNARVTHQPTARNPFNEDDPSGEPQVIDEDTASLQPASRDKRSQQFMEYEAQERAERPSDNTPAGVTVLGGDVSSRAICFCEEQKRGSITSNQAIEWLDGEEKILTDGDISYVITNSAFESVKSVARRILADRG
jgi:hypothetical protein